MNYQTDSQMWNCSSASSEQAESITNNNSLVITIITIIDNVSNYYLTYVLKKLLCA